MNSKTSAITAYSHNGVLRKIAPRREGFSVRRFDGDSAAIDDGSYAIER